MLASSWLAWIGIPIPLGDAEIMLPPAMEMAAGRGLRNPFWITAHTIDPNETRLIYHGYLLQILAGSILPSKEPGRFLPHFLLSVNLGLVLSASILAWQMWRRIAAPSWSLAIALGSIPVLAAAMGAGSASRPEVLAAIPITLAASYGVMHSGQRFAVASGIAVGISGLISPLTGVHSAIALVAAHGWRNEKSAAAWNSLLSGVTAGVVTICGFCFVYPFPFADWLHGMAEHGKLAPLGRVQADLWIPVLLLDPVIPGMGLPCMVTAGALSVATWKRWKQLEHPLIWTGFLVILTTMLAFDTVLIPNRKYNFIPLLPAACAASVWFCRRHSAALLTVAICCLVPGLGFARIVITSTIADRMGATYENAKATIDRSGIEANSSVGVTGAAIYLMSDLTHARNVDRNSLAQSTTRAQYEWLIIGQQASGLTTPPHIEGYQLIEDAFISRSPSIFHFTIGNTMPGYGIAVYRRSSNHD